MLYPPPGVLPPNGVLAAAKLIAPGVMAPGVPVIYGVRCVAEFLGVTGVPGMGSRKCSLNHLNKDDKLK